MRRQIEYKLKIGEEKQLRVLTASILQGEHQVRIRGKDGKYFASNIRGGPLTDSQESALRKLLGDSVLEE